MSTHVFYEANLGRESRMHISHEAPIEQAGRSTDQRGAIGRKGQVIEIKQNAVCVEKRQDYLSLYSFALANEPGKISYIKKLCHSSARNACVPFLGSCIYVFCCSIKGVKYLLL